MTLFNLCFCWTAILGAKSRNQPLYTNVLVLYQVEQISSDIEILILRHWADICRGEKKPIPEDLKDEKYFERRKRNNLAAKKSRDQRKVKKWSCWWWRTYWEGEWIWVESIFCEGHHSWTFSNWKVMQWVLTNIAMIFTRLSHIIWEIHITGSEKYSFENLSWTD